MSGQFTAAAAQLGPNGRNDARSAVVARMVAFPEQPREAGCTCVVFPEMALTTFFPRCHLSDAAEVQANFEAEMPGPDTTPLFEAARE